MKKNLLIVVMAMLAFGYQAMAQKVAVQTDSKAGWHKIAETSADLKMDKDEIVVLGADHFKSIRLKVLDEPLEVSNISVIYENGQKQDIEVRRLIKAGGKTRVIDLDGRDRAIKKILLMYKSVPNAAHDKAHVEIWGMK